ncbi:MAG: hypothetical protein IT258_09625 [Saprospiraceae bacterium]|nr:hypothetical protein [Saprospiraceae bacterium]
MGQQTDLVFNHLTLDNGLSQSINSYVSRDSKGFVWLSSTDGLNRFDGQNVKVYGAKSNSNHALFGANVYSRMFEDSDGDLWFSTFDAIHCYRYQRDDFDHFFIEDKGKSIGNDYNVLSLDEDGWLWLIAGDNFFKWNTKTDPNGKHAFIKLGPSSDSKGVVFFSKNGDGAIHVFGWSYGFNLGVRHFVVKQNKLILQQELLNEPGLRSFDVVVANDTTVWLTSNKGLYRYNPQNGQQKFVAKIGGFNMGEVTHVLPYRDSLLWASGANGLLLIHVEKAQVLMDMRHEPSNPRSLMQDNIRELFLDKDENLWVSTWLKGVSYCNLKKRKFDTIRLQGKDAGDFLSPGSLTERPDGLIWNGSPASGLSVLNREGRVVKDFSAVFPNVLKTLFLPDSLLLVSTNYNGIKAMKRGKLIDVLAGDDRQYEPYDILDLSGRIIGSNDTAPGLIEIKLKKNHLELWPVKLSPSFNTVFWDHLYQDRNGRLYLEKQGGGLVLTSGGLSNLKWDATIPFLGIITGWSETSTAVWVSGEFGLFSIEKGANHYRFFDENNGLPSRLIYSVLPDNAGNLWLGTNKGLAKFNPEKGISRVYTLSDGIQSLEYNKNAVLSDSKGDFWFGGINGFNVFNPEAVADRTPPPVVRLTAVDVNEHPLLATKNVVTTTAISLPYDSNTVAFSFVALEFSDPKNNQLKYRLVMKDGEAYDDAWVLCNTAQGYARYANLPPGEYKLLVTGFNSDGIEAKEKLTISVTIRPPYWKTWWFKLLMATLLAWIAYSVIAAYYKHQLRLSKLTIREQRITIDKQKALQKERNRIAGEMHDDLGGGLTSIRVLVERLQMKNLDAESLQVIEKVANHAQSLVRQMNEIIWAMNSNFDKLDTMVSYIRQYAVEFLDTNDIRCKVHRPEAFPDITVTGEMRRNIYLAVKESIHNVVKHSGADRVTLNFELKGDDLIVKVQDNGKGLPDDMVKLFGNGLTSMKQRLESMGGSFTIQSHEGVLLTFVIPILKEPSNE